MKIALKIPRIGLTQWYAALSTLLLVAIVVIVPWEEISNAVFTDLENYRFRIRYLQRVFTDTGDLFQADSLLTVFSSELTWLAILQLSVHFDINMHAMLFSISLISTTMFGYACARFAGPWFSLLMLFNPAFIDLANSQIRSVFAISLVLLVITLTNRQKLHFIVILFCATIHTSMLVFLVIYWAALWLQNFGGSLQDKRTILFGVSLAAVPAFLVLAPIMLEFLGDRRSLSVGGGKSILFVAPWLGLFFLLCVGARKEAYSSWVYPFTILLLVIVLYIELTLGGLFRMINMCSPIIFASLRFLTPTYFLMAVSGLIANNIFFFLLWL